MSTLQKCKIALVCTGLGGEKRGFESFTESLFQALRRQAPYTDVTLFQGKGVKGERRIVLPNLHRYDRPARWFGCKKAYLLETRSFALSLYPWLRYGGYDIVHYNDLTMGSTLFHLRRYFGGKFKLLYCNGAPSPPIHYHHRCDFAQVLTGPAYEEACMFGIPKERLFFIPYGVNGEMFSPDVKDCRQKVRGELGIPEDAKVVLTVAALKREHKRIDHLLREIAQLGNSAWLVAAGQKTQETESLKKEAEYYLPGRWRFVSWPHEWMPWLYGTADVFTLGSLSEGFGLVIVEAILSGLPVVIHDEPSFRWIAGESPVFLVDMSRTGELSRALNQLMSKKPERVSRTHALERFSWDHLIPRYVEMYKKVSVNDGLAA